LRTDAAARAAVNHVADWIDRAAIGEVLIATDFDGTLTEIVDRPDDARLDERAIVALGRLARAAKTHVAILSGRTLSDVAPRVAGIGPVWLASDHGSVVVDPAQRTHRFDEQRYDAQLVALRSRAEDLARVFRGAHVECKPSSIALHYRDVPPHKQGALVEMFRMSCAAHRARALLGRKVIEGRFGHGDKGVALDYILSRIPSGTSLVYVGDDATDEPALSLAHTHPLGLALHVSSEERLTPRVQVHGWLAGPREWLEILEALAKVRRPHADA